MSSESRTLTLAQLHAEATGRFGDDPLHWAFQCPTCKDIATGDDFKAVLDDNRTAEQPKRRGRPVIWSDVLGRECIGRYLGALKGGSSPRGCNWAAFGLFSGPWFVTMPDSDRHAPSFALAPKPAVAPASAGAGAATADAESQPEPARSGGEGS
ncbi:VVA0879 family protein [Streptomyces sp. NPDC005302]|uniref:VVA0879 family protein n=1 Tax=Streptomyces sp. NPDC005302 TaxID=3154675 RepID=UPI0033B57C54